MERRLVRCRQRLIAAGLLLLSACGEPPLAPLPPQATILAFGDSLTAGVGAGPAYSYPSVLAELSGRRVINAGVSGETTGAGRLRLPDLLDAHRPDLLLLLEGGNDILRNHDPAATKANLAAMLDDAARRDVPTVLIAVPQKSLFSNAAPLYRELADERGLVLIDALVAGLLRSPRYKADGVHFNRAGYRAMAEAIYDVLRDNGAL